MSAHVSAEKKAAVKEFLQILTQYPIVGVVNMQSLPTPQLQNMRGSLRHDNVMIKMTKKRVLKIILEEADKTKPGVAKLIPYLEGMPAMLFAKENPFKLYKKIQSKKSQAPAKPGQICPKEIVVPAGPTPFAPGPIIGELGKFKIKAGIENGKVVVKEDAIVAHKGDLITAELAGILQRFNVQPMEIGLDLVAVFEAGSIFMKDVLAVDEKAYIENITQAHRQAFNLAIECAILNTQTTEFLLGKAFTEAKAVALDRAIISKEIAPDLLARASAQATSVESALNK
ncbi:MAG TPA: 50S ribosomal protein L10 [Acidobacteriota bacterium]|nr:50S ribosomal protein L10 [Acidobacteriota bacterium]